MKSSASSSTRWRNPPARKSAGRSIPTTGRSSLAYKTVTDERCEPDSWAAITRNERFNRYWRAMQAGQLRREKLVLFLSKRIAVESSRCGEPGQLLADHYRRILTQYHEAFDQHGRVIASLFEPHGGSGLRSMSTEDLFRYYAIFFNPSYLRRDNYDPIGQFTRRGNHPSKLLASGRAGRAKAFGFFADGYYHNLVILKRRPQRTRRGIFWALTSLPFLDYSITVNLYPQNIRREINRRKSRWSACAATICAERKHSLLTSKEVKEQRIRNWRRGTPFPSFTISSFTFGTRARTG